MASCRPLPTATVGVVPLPSAGADTPWWALLGGAAGDVHVCARLPFLSGGNSRGGALNALVVAACQPEPSGNDSSFLVVSCTGTQSRSRLVEALRQSGFDLRSLFEAGAAASADGGVSCLVEVDGFCESNDAALAALAGDCEFISSVRVVGAAAVPPGLRWDGSPAEGGSRKEGGQ
mgnify:FL=1